MSTDFSKIEKFISKNYGAACFSAEQIINEKDIVVPISPALNLITWGGIPLGSWVSISGAPKVGKTTTALTIAANAQKEKYGECFVVFLDVEGRLKKINLNGIAGLNTNEDAFKIIRSEKGKLLYSADYLNIAADIIKNVENCVVIIDSISALCDEKVASGGIGTETRGHGAKLVTQFCDTLANAVRINKCIVIGMVHMGANVSGYGSPWVEKAAQRWHYQADVKLRVKNIKPQFWTDGDNKTVGQKINWICDTCALGRPNGEVEGYIRYGIGVDKLKELIEQAETLGLIEKSGSWFTITCMKDVDKDYDEKKYKAQGAEKLYAMISADTLLIETLNEKVKAFFA